MDSLINDFATVKARKKIFFFLTTRAVAIRSRLLYLRVIFISCLLDLTTKCLISI